MGKTLALILGTLGFVFMIGCETAPRVTPAQQEALRLQEEARGRWVRGPEGTPKRRHSVLVIQRSWDAEAASDEERLRRVEQALLEAAIVQDLKVSPHVSFAGLTTQMSPAADVIVDVAAIQNGATPSVRVSASLADGTSLLRDSGTYAYSTSTSGAGATAVRSGSRAAVNRIEHGLDALASQTPGHVAALRVKVAGAIASDLPTVSSLQMPRFQPFDKVRVFFFWSSWAGPSTLAISKRLPELREAWAGKPVVVTLVSTFEKDNSSWLPKLRELGYGKPEKGLVFLDPEIGSKWAAEWDVKAVPTCLVFACDGSVIPGQFHPYDPKLIDAVANALQDVSLGTMPGPTSGVATQASVGADDISPRVLSWLEKASELERKNFIDPLTRASEEYAKKLAPVHAEYVAEVQRIERARQAAADEARRRREEAERRDRMAFARGMSAMLSGAASGMAQGDYSGSQMNQAVAQSGAYESMAENNEMREGASRIEQAAARAALMSNEQLLEAASSAALPLQVEFEGQMVELRGSYQEKLASFRAKIRERLLQIQREEASKPDAAEAAGAKP
jgi:hypothetical protein